MISHRKLMLIAFGTSTAFQIYYSLVALSKATFLTNVVEGASKHIMEAPDQTIGFTSKRNGESLQVVQYHELTDVIENMTASIKHNSETSYHVATVKSTKEGAWFEPIEHCTETCCVKTVAISMDHEDRQLLNTMDGLDLADVVMRRNPGPRHLIFHANQFHENMIPCLQPGTIIHLNNNPKILRYFWSKIRPLINVPYILVTSDADQDSPDHQYTDRLENDPLLIRWYGQNPRMPSEGNSDSLPKFRPMPLGLSMYHPQSKYLTPYLQLTNYTNPFQDMKRFTSEPVDWDRDVIIFFNRRREHRKVMWEKLCSNSTQHTDRSLSCADRSVTPNQIYSEASRYRFGLSPPGRGWDCYRTYEWLYLGIIPVIEERSPYSQILFEGLPVVHIPNLTHRDTGKADLRRAIQAYVDRPDFGSESMTGGWHRLFLSHWRRKMLQDANRTTIFNSDEGGREYYIGYQYETRVARDPIYCGEPENCVA